MSRAKTSITGPDSAHFGETHGVQFDPGIAKVDPFDWWAIVECSQSGTVVYREFLHLGEQAGYPINDNLATFGPTPSWSSGGASCSVQLVAYDGNGRFSKPYAEDAFDVAP